MKPDVATISNGSLTIDIATEFGPRVVGFTPTGGRNLFADLPGLVIDLPDGQQFTFHGGHRLWFAPEIPATTYAPDDDPVALESENLTAVATGVVDDIEKSVSVEMDEHSAAATVTHVAVNHGNSTVEMALWAITQLRPGGTALLPLGDVADDGGYQPSSQVVGWRYTDWGDLKTGPSNVVCVSGSRTTPTKLGTALSRGWLAYLFDGWLFAKYASTGTSSLDLGATGQVYACADFLELETLSLPVKLEPGQAADHREVWRVWQAPESIDETVRLVESEL